MVGGAFTSDVYLHRWLVRSACTKLSLDAVTVVVHDVIEHVVARVFRVGGRRGLNKASSVRVKQEKFQKQLRAIKDTFCKDISRKKNDKILNSIFNENFVFSN